MSNLAYAKEYDDNYDNTEALRQGRDDAREEIINTLLSTVSVNFSYVETWSLEEILENYLNIPDHKLDQYIQYECEGMY